MEALVVDALVADASWKKSNLGRVVPDEERHVVRTIATENDMRDGEVVDCSNDSERDSVGSCRCVAELHFARFSVSSP